MKRIFWKLRVWAKLAILALGLGPSLTEFCKVCGRKQPLIWHAAESLWLEINYGKRGGVFCPECFDLKARERGISIVWEVREE